MVTMKRVGTCLLKVTNYKRFYSQDTVKKKLIPIVESDIHLPKPEFNIEFLCDPRNRDMLAKNICKRKSIGNIDRVIQLYQNCAEEDLFKELSKIPNLTDPTVLEYENDKTHLLELRGVLPDYGFKPQEFSKLVSQLKLLRTEQLGPLTGTRSYILLGDLAELEQALIAYTLKELLKHNFQLVSVPDILPSEVIERCGMINSGERTLVYQLQSDYDSDLSLSGTAEMALAYKLCNKVFNYSELPLNLAAVSRCYRAEVSNLLEERGIYRVHQFTKVEMFACSEQNKSAETMDKIINIQKTLFENLGLHFKVIDMPPNELGSPAYRKIDMEAWMPGRNLFGEISSCSNCTDYQSRRLNIKYIDKEGITVHTHTLNGTACAIPRMLIAICETHQLANGNIAIPEKLQSFMNGKKVIKKANLPKMKQLRTTEYETYLKNTVK